MKILLTGGNGNIAKTIKKNMSNYYDITSPSRNELNILNFEEIKIFLNNNNYDILIHTAIEGGRRTKEDEKFIVKNNLLMFENILYFVNRFKMIINLDSGAIYDRSTDILNRKEDDISTIPTDYYGFSKYIIYKRSLQYYNIYNFRIFNIFHTNEEPDRFIKSCFLSKKNKTPITIYEDKYFDFVYEDDFIKIIKYYADNFTKQEILEKTINICYEQKYKLSDIAKLILKDENSKLIQILNNNFNKNYSGDCSKLYKFNLPLIGLSKSLDLYEKLV